MLCITKLGTTIVIGYLVVECFVGDTSEASSRFGGFLKWGGHHQISKTRPFQYWNPWWLGYPPFQETTIWPWRLLNSDLKSGAKGSGSIREPNPNRLNTGFHWGPREPPSWPSRKKRGFVAPNSWTHLDIPISQDLQTFSEESIGSCRLPAQNRWFLFGPGLKPATNSKSPVSHWFNSW